MDPAKQEKFNYQRSLGRGKNDQKTYLLRIKYTKYLSELLFKPLSL